MTRRQKMISAFWLGCAMAASGLAAAPAAAAAAEMIPVGVASVDITPDEALRMYGYASRTQDSEGVAGRLMAKALALGDDDPHGPAVLLTVDAGAVPAAMRDELLRRVQRHAPLKSERFVLANSHTHAGPNLMGLERFEGPERAVMTRYAEQLLDRLEQVVLEALEARQPARLDRAAGRVEFAANRRVLTGGRWTGFGAVPDGPVDHSLPLLRVTDAEGRLVAVVVNYACHCTTLRADFMEIHGDWAGAAQQYIEADHPGATALVTIGCGGDADPHPHGTADLAQRHGRALADEVRRLLQRPLQPVAPSIEARSVTLEVPYHAAPTADDLRAAAGGSWALERLARRLELGEPLPEHEAFQITVWTFGESLAMVFLSDEVVVDYALRMKRELDGGRLWITAYANAVSRYIVSERLIGEGGYEVRNSLSALVTFGHPERLEPSMESRILQAVRELLPEQFR